MAKIRKHMHYADTRAELAEYKDAYHGAIEDALWDEDELVDHQPASKKKKRSKRPGCPGNEGNAHVYVWVPYPASEVWWRTDAQYEIKVCCGCEKRAHGKSFRRKNV